MIEEGTKPGWEQGLAVAPKQGRWADVVPHRTGTPDLEIVDGRLPPHVLSDCRLPVQASSREDDLPILSVSPFPNHDIHTDSLSDAYAVLHNPHVRTQLRQCTPFRPSSQYAACSNRVACLAQGYSLSQAWEVTEGLERGSMQARMEGGWSSIAGGLVAIGRRAAAGEGGKNGMRG